MADDRAAQEQERIEAKADQKLASLPLVDSVFHCPKCRFGHLTYQYANVPLADCISPRMSVHDYGSFMLTAKRGVIVRGCAQCRYEWYERPADVLTD